ncbi:MFS general substrate transporter [Mycena maculata]|uniref:MFS general substrate transporter n=1 Tax=Mycena maculata TaxID=230809 RepID=A0AAD7HDP1_9AGAR|nr:MFS general substrate transporter [Mycena maculata]
MTGGSFGPSSLPANGRFTGTARVLGPPPTHLLTLTLPLLGVQIFWSVEMSYASPYLLSLGLTPSNIALTLLAGPLSGLIVQPLIGALADSSTSRWGRRRPWALGGCMLSAAGMLLLGYTRAVGRVFGGGDGLTVGLAVLSIFVIDFSINAVQAVDRALLVDTLPPAQQAAGNAWAAAMLGAGSVVGFFVGNLPLTTLLPFLRAESELQALSSLVSLLLVGTHVWTAFWVRERVLLKPPTPSPHSHSRRAWLTANPLAREVRAIWANARALPKVIRMIGSILSHPSSYPLSPVLVFFFPLLLLYPYGSLTLAQCFTQFFAWLAWFPVLFYTTLYVADVFVQGPATRQDPATAAADADAATRLGARAQLLSALLALATNVLLPASATRASPRRFLPPGTGLASDWAVPLPTIWAASHALFAACMFGTFFTHSVTGATLLIGATGIAWGVTQWAPFSLLAEAILTAPAPTTTAAGSIRLADARTPDRDADREAEALLGGGGGGEAGFLVGSDSDSDSDSGADSGADSEREDEEGVLVPRGDEGAKPGKGIEGKGGRKGKENKKERERGVPAHAHALLGNARAQLSVVDVRTPVSVAAPRFGGPASSSSSRAGLVVDTAVYGDGEGEGEGEGWDGDGDLEAGEGGGGRGEEGGGLSAKAGVILGIHNIFIVVPQFLVTGLAAIVFALADGPAPAAHPLAVGIPRPVNATFGAAANTTVGGGNETFDGGGGNATLEAGVAPMRNSVVYVFRIGCIWSCIAFVLAWRLARHLKHA